MTKKAQEVVEINEYGLFAFCAKAQELIQQGYKFDLEENVRSPMSYGTMFVAYMVKDVEPVMVISPPMEEAKVKPETTFTETPTEEVNTELVAEKPQTEDKVETETVSEPKVKTVKKKAGTE